MSSYSRIQLENWLKTIKLPAQSKVIDIGGSQNPVKKRLGNCGEASVFKILDLPNPHERKAEVDIVDDIQDKRIDDYKPEFDVAFCLEVSEYLFDPLTAFKNINSLLKKGGMLYISFHFVYPVHAPKGKDYLRYTEDGAVKLLEEAGFKIEKMVYRKSVVLCPCHYYRSENMRGLKDYDHKIIGTLIEAKKC